MERVRIKVCGITNREDARLAVRLGADALGFIFTESPRRIDVPTARRIIRQLPPFVVTVGVFKDQTLSEVIETMNYVGLSYAQLHGSESPEYARRLGRRAIKVFLINGTKTREEIERYNLNTIMLDMPKGSVGTILEYADVARQLVGTSHLILAGGLTPENVGEVILRIRPFAVDVASGVESYPGKKSAAKLERFIRAVREVEHVLRATR